MTQTILPTTAGLADPGNQSGNVGLFSPADGSSGPMAPRAAVMADLPARTVTTVSSNTTLDDTHDIVLCNTHGTSIEITLSTAVGFTRTYTIKNIDSGNVTFAFTGGQTIDAGVWAGSLAPAGGSGVNSIVIASDNANWWIVEGYSVA